MPIWPVLAGLAVIIVALTGLLIWAGGSGPVCPKGKTLTVVTWVPIVGSKGITTVVPVYGCTEGGR